jgi:cytochrome oxidase Cu insertion factor (SCO1/SenC/PrrC family)
MQRVALLSVSFLLLAGCAATLSGTAENEPVSEEPPAANPTSNTPSWRTVEMTDVTTNQTFTVESLQEPLLIESFAIWCPPCTRQQQEIKALKEDTNVTSVSINVDPEEDDDRVRSHASSNQFTWRYVTAPKNTTELFIEEFGRTFISPPSVPVILVCDDNTSKLLNRGVTTATQLQEEIDEACNAP